MKEVFINIALIKKFINRLILRFKILFKKKKRFNSFEEASNSCRNGYENELLIRTIAEKTNLFEKELSRNKLNMDFNAIRTLATLGILSSHNKNFFKVVDFGGACGYHYLIARKFLDKNSRFNWLVLETPPMVDAAHKLHSDKPEIEFKSSLSKSLADKFQDSDLLIAGSSLQYCPNPLTMLCDLMSLNPEYIFITRTPMSKENDFFDVQNSFTGNNGPGKIPNGFPNLIVKYPISFVRKSAYKNIIEAKYDIIFDIHEGYWEENDYGEEVEMVSLVARIRSE